MMRGEEDRVREVKKIMKRRKRRKVEFKEACWFGATREILVFLTTSVGLAGAFGSANHTLTLRPSGLHGDQLCSHIPPLGGNSSERLRRSCCHMTSAQR